MSSHSDHHDHVAGSSKMVENTGRDREVWEDLLPDPGQVSGAALVKTATKAVRFAISGLYDLPPNAFDPRTGKTTECYMMAYIPEPQMQVIQAAPLEALTQAREVNRLFWEAYYDRRAVMSRRQAREELFRRLNRIVTAAEGDVL